PPAGSDRKRDPKAPRLLALAVALLWGGGAVAQTEDDLAGRVLGQVDGTQVELPMLSSDYDVDIQGDVATVTLTQRFLNPHAAAMTAEYLFPLNQRAAVYGMTMEVGDEIVQAVIQKKAEAVETFKAAEEEGKAAALLTQHRPNMFTQKIANLMPGMPVTVSLSYVQPVPRIDGAYELVVPLVVGPRYEGAEAAPEAEVEMVAAPGGWEVSNVPVYPAVMGLELPAEIAEDRVSLYLTLASAVPIVSVTSATHALEVAGGEATSSATFEAGRVIDNKDLVVRYVLGGDEVTAGVLTHEDERGGFVSLLIEPPVMADAVEAAPREIVFVLDTSGSMDGLPIAASKKFMEAALEGLRPNDYFRIIRFANDASHFSEQALPATEANLRNGLTFVKRLQAGGGTEIDYAMRTAFGTEQPDKTLRIVVFLSDGYIGDEATVLATIRRQIGAARIYAFGVGTGVNRYLLDAMADEGRGYARYVDPTESALDVAQQLAADLQSPVLTDIEIDWGDLNVTEVTPARIPDLFEGRQLRVLARYEGGEGEVRVNGVTEGRLASLPVEVAPSDGEGSEAIPLIWARSRIADHERGIAVRDGDEAAHEDAITELGLGFGLQSRFTSFVAVSQKVVNTTGESQARAVPLPQVAGVPKTAYPGFSGSSTPEPQVILGLLAIGGLAAARWTISRRRA
ncbi:MAG: VIT domain-containing protein, partial [Pseudomonadota bacterium]